METNSFNCCIKETNCFKIDGLKGTSKFKTDGFMETNFFINYKNRLKE